MYSLHKAYICVKLTSVIGLFVVYPSYSNDFFHGYANKVFLTEKRNGVQVVWSQHTTQESSLYTEFTAQGISVCKSGNIMISIWNNEIGKRGKRRVGKVIALTSKFRMIEGFQIFMDKNQPLFVCPTYLKENGNGDICLSDVGSVLSRTLEACCASGIGEFQDTSTLNLSTCVAILCAISSVQI